MKYLILFLLIGFAHYTGIGQNHTLFFTYDKAGNRIKQKLDCSIQEEDNECYKRLEVFPNPAYGVTYIDFLIEEEGEYNINLFDANGKIVLEIQNGELLPGYFSKIIDLSNFTSGIYFIRFDLCGEFKNKKIIIQK